MSYEQAMGTEDGTTVAMPAVDTIEEGLVEQTEEDREALRQSRAAERQRELDEMWQTGRWREGPFFGRWLLERVQGSSPCRMMLFRFPCVGLTHFLASGHCAMFVPTAQECSGLVPQRRVVALGTFVWPLLTSYFAWRKTDGCWGWTAVGAAAGLSTIPLVMFAGMLLSGASFRQ